MKFRVLALAAATLALLAGCAINTAAVDSTPQDSFSFDEQMFAQMMIPHHQQAIEMSDLALERAQNPEILELATTIKSGQAPEIELMETWFESNATDHSGHMAMGGMLTDEELAELEQSSGVEFERLFLEGMIKHHQGALEMVEMLDGSENQVVIKLREEIRSAQKAEIDQMVQLLSSY